jgi:hypothetical protein
VLFNGNEMDCCKKAPFVKGIDSSKLKRIMPYADYIPKCGVW